MPRARALIIDDNPHADFLLRDYFGHLDFDLSTRRAFARSVGDAMEIIESDAEFDIALIAADPEPVSGLSLFNQLKD